MATRAYWLVFLALASLVAFPGSPLKASEEEFLEVAEIRIVAAEREQTGKVVLAAKTAEGEFKEATIEAFGKKYALAKEQLDKLSGFPLDGLVMTHEAGYERLGGHIVYFKLKKVRHEADGRLVEEKVVVSVSKGKGLAVATPTTRVVNQKGE